VDTALNIDLNLREGPTTQQTLRNLATQTQRFRARAENLRMGIGGEHAALQRSSRLLLERERSTRRIMALERRRVAEQREFNQVAERGALRLLGLEHAVAAETDRTSRKKLESSAKLIIAETKMELAGVRSKQRLTQAELGYERARLTSIRRGERAQAAAFQRAYNWIGRFQQRFAQFTNRAFRWYVITMAAFWSLTTVLRPLQNFFRSSIRYLQVMAGWASRFGRAFVESVTEIQTLEGRMRVFFGGATEKAISWAINEAMGKPFEWSALAEAMMRAMSLGVDEFRSGSMGRVMQAAQDLAAAFQRPVEDMVSAIVLGASGGPGGRRLRQLGFSPYMMTQYGAAPGAIPGTLAFDTPEKIQQNLDAIIRMIEDRLGGASDKLAFTWNAMLEDLTDVWTRFALGLHRAGLIEPLLTAVATIRARLGELRDSGVMDAWAQKLARALDWLRKPLQYISERIPNLVVAAIQLGVKASEAFGKWYEKLAGGSGIEGVLDRIMRFVQRMIPLLLRGVQSYLAVARVGLEGISAVGQVVLSVIAGISSFGAKIGVWGPEMTESIERGLALVQETHARYLGRRGGQPSPFEEAHQWIGQQAERAERASAARTWQEYLEAMGLPPEVGAAYRSGGAGGYGAAGAALRAAQSFTPNTAGMTPVMDGLEDIAGGVEDATEAIMSGTDETTTALERIGQEQARTTAAIGGLRGGGGFGGGGGAVIPAGAGGGGGFIPTGGTFAPASYTPSLPPAMAPASPYGAAGTGGAFQGAGASGEAPERPSGWGRYALGAIRWVAANPLAFLGLGMFGAPLARHMMGWVGRAAGAGVGRLAGRATDWLLGPRTPLAAPRGRFAEGDWVREGGALRRLWGRIRGARPAAPQAEAARLPGGWLARAAGWLGRASGWERIPGAAAIGRLLPRVAPQAATALRIGGRFLGPIGVGVSAYTGYLAGREGVERMAAGEGSMSGWGLARETALGGAAGAFFGPFGIPIGMVAGAGGYLRGAQVARQRLTAAGDLAEAQSAAIWARNREQAITRRTGFSAEASRIGFSQMTAEDIQASHGSYQQFTAQVHARLDQERVLAARKAYWSTPAGIGEAGRAQKAGYWWVSPQGERVNIAGEAWTGEEAAGAIPGVGRYVEEGGKGGRLRDVLRVDVTVRTTPELDAKVDTNWGKNARAQAKSLSR
jgi:hypothetical protein